MLRRFSEQTAGLFLNGFRSGDRYKRVKSKRKKNDIRIQCFGTGFRAEGRTAWAGCESRCLREVRKSSEIGSGAEGCWEAKSTDANGYQAAVRVDSQS